MAIVQTIENDNLKAGYRVLRASIGDLTYTEGATLLLGTPDNKTLWEVSQIECYGEQIEDAGYFPNTQLCFNVKSAVTAYPITARSVLQNRFYDGEYVSNGSGFSPAAHLRTVKKSVYERFPFYVSENGIIYLSSLTVGFAYLDLKIVFRQVKQDTDNLLFVNQSIA